VDLDASCFSESSRRHCNDDSQFKAQTSSFGQRLPAWFYVLATNRRFFLDSANFNLPYTWTSRSLLRDLRHQNYPLDLMGYTFLRIRSGGTHSHMYRRQRDLFWPFGPGVMAISRKNEMRLDRIWGNVETHIYNDRSGGRFSPTWILHLLSAK